MASASEVKKIYEQVVQDVCTAVRRSLSEEGYDDHTLQELRTLWLARLNAAKALEPLTTTAVDEATTRHHRRTTNNDANHGLAVNNRQATTIRPTQMPTQPNFIPPQMNNTSHMSMANLVGATASGYTRPMTFTRAPNPSGMPSSSMKTSNQIDGSTDEPVVVARTNRRGKKAKKIQITFQLDGPGPIVTDDEDEDEDNEAGPNDDVNDPDDDDDDEGNEEGIEDPDPLCSDDDVSDEEPTELFETDNVVVCQYDKISRTKNKWRFTLKSGVMNINGRDYVFSKAIGEADW